MLSGKSSFLSSILTVALASSVLIACGDDGGGDQIIALEVSPPAASINVGTTQAFTATGIFADMSRRDLTAEVTWASDNEAVATVAGGTATGVTGGTANISATFESLTASAILTVTENSVTQVMVTPANATVGVGGEADFTATAVFQDGTTQNVTADATWASADDAIATIDAGTATGVANGTTTITATFMGITSNPATVVVTPEHTLTGITCLPASASTNVGGTAEFQAIGNYADGMSEDVTDDADWTSSDEDVATVDGGTATGVAAGEAEISASVDGIECDPVTLTVTEAEVVSITLDPPTSRREAGDATPVVLTATALLDDGTSMDVTADCVYSSDDETVATVSNAAGTEGNVTADATNTGSAVITCVRDGITSSPHVITVTESTAVVSVEVAPATATIALGTSQAFTATATFADTRTEDVTDSADTSWSSSMGGVATIDDTGLADSVAAGTTTITATFRGTMGTASLTVTAATLESIAVTPPTASVPAGGTQRYTATGTFSDGSTADISSMVSWGTGAAATATIDLTGLATGVAPGTTAVTAMFMGRTGTASITVTAARVESLVITPASPPDLPVGNVQSFTATATLTDGSTLDVTDHPALTWSSSMAAIASISNAPGTEGDATGLAVGTTNIRARFNNGIVDVSATAVALTVTDAVLESISVTPRTASVPVGFTVAFTATCGFSDGSTSDCTTDASLSWSSSMMGRATISNAAGTKGVATGVAAGTTTITAAIGGVSGTATLTVTTATLTSISVSPGTVSVPRTNDQQFRATGTFSDGFTADLTTVVTWSMTTGAARCTPVTISNAAGTRGLASVGLTAGLGNCNIRAELSGIRGNATLTVIDLGVLNSIVVDIPIDTIRNSAPGNQTNAFATCNYDFGSIDCTDTVTWSIFPVIRATISNAAGSRGRITGLTLGTATVDACLPGMGAGGATVCASDPGSGGSTDTVTIVDCPFVSIEVRADDPGPTVNRGLTRQFRAFASYNPSCTTAPAVEVTGLWTSDDETVATVGLGSGLVTGEGSGRTDITAIVNVMGGSLTDSLEVTVTDSCIESVSIAPATVTLPSGVTSLLVATATFSDGSTETSRTSPTLFSFSTADSTVVDLDPAERGRIITGAVTMATTVRVTATATAAFCGMTAPSGFSDVTVSTATLTGIRIEARGGGAPPTSIAVGNRANLQAIGTFSSGPDLDITDVVSWTSSNGSVASVVAGVVTGNSTGTVAITATLGSQFDTIMIDVGDAVIRTVTIEREPGFTCGTSGGAFPRGASVPYRVRVTYSDDSEEVYDDGDTSGMVTWSDGGSAVFDVSGNGLVDMDAAGSGTLRATFMGITGTLSISVVVATPVSIAVTPNPFTIPVSSTQQFTAIVSFGSGFTSGCDFSAGGVVWDADPAASISINSNGLATTTAITTTMGQVTASFGAVTGLATGVVSGTCIQNIRLRPSDPSTPLGIAFPFIAEARNSDGTFTDITASGSTAWMSSMPGVATVAAGTATPVSAGTTNITATYTPGASACAGTVAADFTRTTSLTVTAATLSSIAVTCNNLTDWGAPIGLALPRFLRSQCTATGTFSDGSMANITNTASWSSTATGTADVDNGSFKGRVTAGATAGSAVISAQSGARLGTFDLTVVDAPIDLMTVTPASASAPVGFTQQFTATGRFTRATVSHSYNITNLSNWSSSPAARASVGDTPDSNKGLATALVANATPAIITAGFRGTTGTANFLVTDDVVCDISVTPATASLSQGNTLQYTAIATYTTGGPGGPCTGPTVDLTGSVIWGTSDASLATINAAGLATANNGGLTGMLSITADFMALRDTAALTITDACINGITLTRVAPNTDFSIPANVPIWYQTSVTFSDGTSDSNYTGSTIFSTSAAGQFPAPDSAGYSYSMPGAVTGPAGETTITATVPDTATCTPGTPITDTDTRRVNARTLTNIVVTPAGASTAAGTQLQYTAIGQYSAGPDYDITRRIDNWETNDVDPPIATASNTPPINGRVTTFRAGTVPVIATQGSESGSTTLTVTSAQLQDIRLEGWDTLGECNLNLGSSSAWISGAGFEHPRDGYETFVRVIGIFTDGTEGDVTAGSIVTSSSAARATVVGLETFRGLDFWRIRTGASTGAVTLTATNVLELGSDGDTLTLTVRGGTLTRATINPAGPDPINLVEGTGVSPASIVALFGSLTFCVNLTAQYQVATPPPVFLGITGGWDLFAFGAGATTMRVYPKAGDAVSDTIIVTAAARTAVTTLECRPGTINVSDEDTFAVRIWANYSDGSSADVTDDVATSLQRVAVDGATDVQFTATKGVFRASDEGQERITARFNDGIDNVSTTDAGGQNCEVTITP